jgi:hypothetical protein
MQLCTTVLAMPSLTKGVKVREQKVLAHSLGGMLPAWQIGHARNNDCQARQKQCVEARHTQREGRRSLISADSQAGRRTQRANTGNSFCNLASDCCINAHAVDLTA